MSRTKRIKPSPGKEYWTKRPLSRNHGANPGKFTKKLTHRLERIEGKITKEDISEALEWVKKELEK